MERELEFVAVAVLDGPAFAQEILDACTGGLGGFWGVTEAVVSCSGEGGHLRFGWWVGGEGVADVTVVLALTEQSGCPRILHVLLRCVIVLRDLVTRTLLPLRRVVTILLRLSIESFRAQDFLLIFFVLEGFFGLV